MELIREWIIPAGIAVLAGVVLEMLLPDTNIKKYVKFAISLAVMLVILLPVVNFFAGRADASVSLEAIFRDAGAKLQETEEKDMGFYKDYVYEVYMRNNKNKNE